MADIERTKAPTLKDLAREAGVSLTSASYAINGTGSVGPKTRAHVLDVAQRIGFRLNLTAKAMRSGRSGMLALVVPDLGNPFFAALAQAVFREARLAGYQGYLTNTEGSEALEAQALTTAVGLRVDGVIWFCIRDKDTSGGVLANTPTVVLDRVVAGYDTVTIDYHAAGRLAGEHLLAHGHRRIGIIAGPLDIAAMRDRCAGVESAVAGIGDIVFNLENAFSLDLEPSVKTALVDGGATAVFAGADLIAIGAIRHVQRHRMTVPRDISIIGFDDIDLAALTQPALTTIELPIEEIAREAVTTLTAQIASGNRRTRQSTLGTKLIGRASVRMLSN